MAFQQPQWDLYESPVPPPPPDHVAATESDGGWQSALGLIASTVGFALAKAATPAGPLVAGPRPTTGAIDGSRRCHLGESDAEGDDIAASMPLHHQQQATQMDMSTVPPGTILVFRRSAYEHAAIFIGSRSYTAAILEKHGVRDPAVTGEQQKQQQQQQQQQREEEGEGEGIGSWGAVIPAAAAAAAAETYYVIHYSVPPGEGDFTVATSLGGLGPAHVRIDTFDAAKGPDAVFMVTDHEHCGFPAKPGPDVLERALSRFGEQNYCLMGNNCQHFVNWCVYDVDSKLLPSQVAQLEAAQTLAVGVAAGLGVLLGAAFFMFRGRRDDDD